MKSIEELGISSSPWRILSKDLCSADVATDNGKIVSSIWNPKEEDIANARLIAAAPELYAALHRYFVMMRERAIFPDEVDALHDATNALLKASGEL